MMLLRRHRSNPQDKPVNKPVIETSVAPSVVEPKKPVKKGKKVASDEHKQD